MGRSVAMICTVMIVSAWRTEAAELKTVADQSGDAAALMKRGTEYAARKDFKDALVDLQKACELAPREPDCFYELGMVQWHSGHPDLALQTFGKTLELKPDHVPTLLARAQLSFKDHARAKQDLDAIDRSVDPEDDVRLDAGLTYEAMGELPPAIHQFDLWIARTTRRTSVGCSPWMRAAGHRPKQTRISIRHSRTATTPCGCWRVTPTPS
jgi:Tfp pilus assembly protein PilF